MKQNQFYCVACRKKVSVPAKSIRLTSIKNKRSGSIPALKAKCKCGTKLTRFVSRKSASKMRSKGGKSRSRKRTRSAKKSRSRK
jgi:hypothetical protein